MIEGRQENFGEPINLKYSHNFSFDREFIKSRITTNIPLNPLMPTILLDNPSFARKLMRYSARDQSCIIVRYINLPSTDSAMFKITEIKPMRWDKFILIRANIFLDSPLMTFFFPSCYPHVRISPVISVSRIFFAC